MIINNPLKVRALSELAVGELYVTSIRGQNALCIFLEAVNDSYCYQGVLAVDGVPSMRMEVEEYSEKSCLSYGADWYLHIDPASPIEWQPSPSRRDLSGRLLIGKADVYITFLENEQRKPAEFGFFALSKGEYRPMRTQPFGIGANWSIWLSRQEMVEKCSPPIFHYQEDHTAGGNSASGY